MVQILTAYHCHLPFRLKALTKALRLDEQDIISTLPEEFYCIPSHLCSAEDEFDCRAGHRVSEKDGNVSNGYTSVPHPNNREVSWAGGRNL